MKTEEQFKTKTIRPLAHVWCAVLLLAGLLTTSLASAQTLKFRFNFEDTGTTTTDTASGVVLNMVNSSSVATDYHGAAGTGVGGAGKALNLTSGADGGTGPIVSTVNNATLGFGSVSSWTVTEWVNPSATSASLARLFIFGTNGVVEQGAANSFSFKIKSTSSLNVFINATEATAVEPTISLPLGSWTFIAYTYDGTTLSMYVGTASTAAQLVGSSTYAGQSIDFGTAGSLFLGNRNSNGRCFKGYIDDTRFYTGAGDATFVESVRQAGLPVIATEAWDNGAGSMNWNTTDANWNSGGKWTNANSALFGTTGVGKVSVTESITALNVSVTNAGYVITNGGGTLTISGAITNNVDVGLSAYLLGGLTKAGSGNLTISALETNSGNTILNGGKLTIDAALGGLYWGSVSGNIQVNSGATLSFSGGISYQSQAFKNLGPSAGTIIINGGTLQHTGNSNAKSSADVGSGHLFDIGALGATLDSATAGQEFSLGYRYDYSGGVLTSAGGTLTLTGVGNGDLNYSLPGSGGVAMTGSGIWKLTGTNTYSGGTTISAGTLSIANYTNLPTTGTLTVNGGTLQVTNTVITNLNPYTVNWSAFNGGLDVASSGNNLTVTNVISGSGSLTKLGSGTLTLANTNSYGGGMTISAGTVVANNLNAIGTGLLTFNGGYLSNSASCSLTNPISLSANSTIAAAAPLTLSGAITNSGALTMIGGSTVTLTGSNTYTNTTTISAGILQIGDGTTDGSIASSKGITDNAALVYNLVGSQSYTNVISGTGILTKTGAGSLTLSAINTFTGGTTVSNGTLVLTNTTDCVVRGTLTVNSGATVSVAGNNLIGFGSTAGANVTNLTINDGTVTSSSPGSFFNNCAVNLTGGTLGSGEYHVVNSPINTVASASTATISGNLLIRPDYGYPNLTVTVAAGSASPDLLVSGVIKQTDSTHIGNVIKNGLGRMVLANHNTYSGNTVINAGTLALSGVGSVASSTNITVAGGATFDASSLSSTFTLGASQTFSNSAVGAIINGTNSTGSGTLSLLYDGVNPSVIITNGGMTLSASTTFKVNKTGAALPLGVYKLIAKATAGNVGLVAGAVPTVTVNNGLSQATLGIVGAELYLTNGGPSTITYGSTSFTYNGSAQTPTIAFGGSTGAKTTNYVGTGATTYSSVNAPTNAGSYYVSNTLAADANYFGVVSSQNFTINQASTFVGATSTQNPSGYKDTVSYIATLPVDATGSVVFSSTNGAFSTNTSSSGSATSLSITNLPRGTNVITVAYLGDGNYLGSSTNLEQIVTNHPPMLAPLNLTRTAGLGLHFPWSQLTNQWSDVDGDAVALTTFNLSTTNSVSLITNATLIGYPSTAPNVADQINYTASDSYGDSVAGVINIAVNAYVTGTNSIVNITTGNPTTLKAYGVIGFSYIIERSTNLTDWASIATNTVSTNGVISVSDSFSDLGGNPPSSAYYRIKWQP